MLTASFCCFRGISPEAELNLWRTGSLGWQEVLVLGTSTVSPRKLRSLRAQIAEAKIALEAGAVDYFINRMAPPHTLRVLPHFRDRIGYLDIETTGLSTKDRITTIALYHQGAARCFVRDQNLGEFLRAIQDVGLLVSYNGKRFDIPRIRKEFHIDLALPHIDLRDCLSAMGYRGGLKRCEKLLGIRRQVEPETTGSDAVTQWQEHLNGNPDALPRLVRYNLQDVLTLELIAVALYNQIMASHPLVPQITIPSQPDLAVL